MFISFLKKLPHSKGFTLIEVLFSIMILGILLSTVLLSLSGQLTHVTDSNSRLQAASIAEEGLEAARSIRDTNWSSLAAGAHGLTFSGGNWTFTSASDTTNGFTRTITVTDASAHERNVDVTVAWTPPGSATQQTYTLSTRLADWRNLPADSGPGGTLEGDWHAPQSLPGGSLLDFGVGFRGIGLTVSSGTLYMAGFGTISQSYELVLVDVSNPANPVKHGSINTSVGINKVAVNAARTYAFVANANTTNQMQVISVANIDKPTLVKSFGIVGNNNKGRTLVLVGNTLYLGTEGPAPAEFNVVDVSTPTNPVLRGSVSIGNDINEMAVNGHYAYVVDDFDSRELSIIDITTSTSPIVVANVDLPGNNNGESVFYDPVTKRVYVGRQLSTVDGEGEVYVIDAQDPRYPVILGSLDMAANVDTVYAEGNLMFVGSQEEQEFRAYDVSNLPAITYYGGIDLGDNEIPTGNFYRDNVFYISVFERYALRIITSS
ncbi:MAG: prepilin-type N-terminal cleavage/methylation domain-containing protein [Patescibacteria group bacterium]